MAKKPIKVTEVVLRDAHQSLLAVTFFCICFHTYTGCNIDSWTKNDPFSRDIHIVLFFIPSLNTEKKFIT